MFVVTKPGPKTATQSLILFIVKQYWNVLVGLIDYEDIFLNYSPGFSIPSAAIVEFATEIGKVHVQVLERYRTVEL